MVDLGRHLGMFDAKHKQPEAAVEVTGEELRAVVLRALDRLAAARTAAGGRRGNELWSRALIEAARAPIGFVLPDLMRVVAVDPAVSSAAIRAGYSAFAS